MELSKTYSPAEIEAKWGKAWRESGVFHCQAQAVLRSSQTSAVRRSGTSRTDAFRMFGTPGPRALTSGGEAPAAARPFTIVIPPPNVTGVLHIGHALNNVLQDVLIRFQRLTGRPTCWVPGADHGGIATNNVLEKQLKAEGLTRHSLGREKFLERMQVWARECKKTILGQLDRLGCALDWDREAFTMDAARAKAVTHAFETLWKDGFIERGEMMVNWCVRCGTALSDIEVEHEDRKGRLWHMRYPEQDGGPGIVVATTRPETMLGDTAVAVNPRDTRYTKFIGKTLRLPLMDRPIPIVADDSVDFAFGTGAVKVTPAHDPNDFEIAQRHKLKAIKVIEPNGKMSPAAGRYAGLSREACREMVLKDLGELLVKTEDHPHAVGVCYRCGQVIEPLLSWQWFVRMKALAEPAIQALDSGEFRVYPDSWGKPYRDWLSNIRDWGISRQIWWGHRIPVWYCLSCNRNLIAVAPQRTSEAGPGGPGTEGWSVHQIPGVMGTVGVEKPAKCAKCGSADFIQDPDVLDTWFSSALWPMSVFGWPDETPDFRAFYPTSILVTGYEILYLWVARMQMMGLYFMGKVPFPHALIHGIVRDKHGKKMSKSLGNVIDPLVMMDKYGTDAFRFSLALQAHPGRDIPFSEESIVGSRNFTNKLWNSTRFVLMNLPPTAPLGGYSARQLSEAAAPQRNSEAALPRDSARSAARPGLDLADYWILGEYEAVLEKVRDCLDRYEVAAAADAVYEFLWDKFCDWYVELAKIPLSGGDEARKEQVRAILVHVLDGTLKLLHPFMPYVTEELHQALGRYAGLSSDSILNARLGSLVEDKKLCGDAAGPMRELMAMITAIRTSRSQLNVPPGMKIKALYTAQSDAARRLVEERTPYLLHLARLERLEPLNGGGQRPSGSATAVSSGCTFYLPLQGVIDFDVERRRLQKELADIDQQAKGLEVRLSNPNFVQRAPREEVEKARALRADQEARRARIRETLQGLD